MQAVIIPVKMLDRSKTRLSEHLTPQDRRDLSVAMLEDVLSQVADHDLLLVVTSDPQAAELALAAGGSVHPDPGQGMSAAVDAACIKAMSDGAEAALVLASDLPMLSARDIRQVIDDRSEVVIASSTDGGTNALYRRPPLIIGAAFGAGSAAIHEKRALSAGVTCRTIEVPGLASDIDDFDDLLRLASSRHPGKSASLARALVSRPDREAGAPAQL